MQKGISPARILGRKNSFCSCVPKFMIVGPTVLIVSIGTGAPLRIDSSKKMNCSMAERPCPPHSVGQPMPSQPSLPHLLDDLAHHGPDAARLRELLLDLGGQAGSGSRRAARSSAPAAPRCRQSPSVSLPGGGAASAHVSATSSPARPCGLGALEHVTVRPARRGQWARRAARYRQVTCNPPRAGSPGDTIETEEPSPCLKPSSSPPVAPRSGGPTRARSSSAGPTT